MHTAIPTLIERSKNRTSRAMLRDGAILIRLAYGLSSAEEQRHIENLQRRMTRIASKNLQRTMIDPLKDTGLDLPVFEVHTVTGSSVHFSVSSSTTKRSSAEKTNNGWNVKKGASDSKKIFHRFLWKLLAISLHQEIDVLVRRINEETFQEQIKSVTLKYMRSRWGSCSLGKSITLSTPLLFTSPEILRYVIIHELAHIPHPNHSPKFWKAVEQYAPEYRIQRRHLRNMTLVRI